MSSTNTEKRAEFIAGLRAFADLIETDPSIPTPTDVDVWVHITKYYTGLDQDQRYDLIHAFAEAHDLPVSEDYKGDRTTEKHFGPVHMHVFAVADEKPDKRLVTWPRTRQTEPAAV